MSLVELMNKYNQSIMDIFSGIYKSGFNDGLESQEVNEKMQETVKTAYKNGVTMAFEAMKIVDNMNADQSCDCFGTYENGLTELASRFSYEEIVDKAMEWKNNPHWMKRDESELNGYTYDKCEWADSRCSRCKQLGVKSWGHCPHCGATMHGVAKPED